MPEKQNKHKRTAPASGKRPAPNDTASMVLLAIPVWLRRAASQTSASQVAGGQDIVDIAATTGAAIGALDTLIRHNVRWQGAWRQRLALAAAAMTARQIGRTEDEATLRDAVQLTRPGDDAGPGGRLFLGWRHLATQPAGEVLKQKSLKVVLEAFGYAYDADRVAALADDIRQTGQASGMADSLTGAFALAQRHDLGVAIGAFIADALLAQRLGWDRAVPLLGAENLPYRRTASQGRVMGGKQDEMGRTRLLVAQTHAALRAIDLSASLTQPAQRLIAIAPRLRAKAADSVVQHLLSEDAIVASRQIAGISDRGLRRLFDRLIELNAVRELSGRPTFRIYGL